MAVTLRWLGQEIQRLRPMTSAMGDPAVQRHVSVRMEALLLQAGSSQATRKLLTDLPLPKTYGVFLRQDLSSVLDHLERRLQRALHPHPRPVGPIRISRVVQLGPPEIVPLPSRIPLPGVRPILPTGEVNRAILVGSKEVIRDYHIPYAVVTAHSATKNRDPFLCNAYIHPETGRIVAVGRFMDLWEMIPEGAVRVLFRVGRVGRIGENHLVSWVGVDGPISDTAWREVYALMGAAFQAPEVPEQQDRVLLPELFRDPGHQAALVRHTGSYRFASSPNAFDTSETILHGYGPDLEEKALVKLRQKVGEEIEEFLALIEGAAVTETSLLESAVVASHDLIAAIDVRLGRNVPQLPQWGSIPDDLLPSVRAWLTRLRRFRRQHVDFYIRHFYPELPQADLKAVEKYFLLSPDRRLLAQEAVLRLWRELPLSGRLRLISMTPSRNAGLPAAFLNVVIPELRYASWTTGDPDDLFKERGETIAARLAELTRDDKIPPAEAPPPPEKITVPPNRTLINPIEVFLKNSKKKIVGSAEWVEKDGAWKLRFTEQQTNQIASFSPEEILTIRVRGWDLTPFYSRLPNPQFPDKSINQSGIYGSGMVILVDFSDERLSRFLWEHIDPIRRQLDDGKISPREAAVAAWEVVRKYVPYDQSRYVRELPNRLYGLGDFIQTGVCNERGMLLQVVLQYLGVPSRMEKGPFLENRHAWVRTDVEPERGRGEALILDPQEDAPTVLPRDWKFPIYRDDGTPFVQRALGTTWFMEGVKPKT